MRTIKRTVADLPNVTNDYSKYLNLLEWKGIIEGKNIFDVDQSSLADAKNIYVNEKNRLVSRDPLQEDKSLPENAVPEGNKLFEVYPAGDKLVYISKAVNNSFTIIIDNSILSNLTTYHLSIIEHYIICFNETNAKVYDINSPELGWQNLTDLAEIPITLRVVGNEHNTYPGNEFTQAYKEQYIWSENSRPDLPTGTAEVILNTPSKQYTWTIPNTNILTDYRILRPLNITVEETDLFSVVNNIICIGRSDYFLISYDEGNTFDRVWYPIHKKFLNIASISTDGQYFFFVAADAVYRCNLGDKSWTGGIFYFKSNTSGEYGTILEASNINAIGYNNICHFLTGDTFTFLLYTIIDDIPNTYIFYKGPSLGEINGITYIGTMNMVAIVNDIEFLESRDITQKDCDKARLKCSITPNQTIASVSGTFYQDNIGQYIIGIYPEKPYSNQTKFVNTIIEDSRYSIINNCDYINIRSINGSALGKGGIKINTLNFYENEEGEYKFSSLVTNPFPNYIGDMVTINSKIYCCSNSAAGSGSYSRLATYDISTNTFSSLKTSPIFTVTSLAVDNNDNNRIYCCGTYNNNNGQFAIYNISAGTFSSLISNPIIGSIQAMVVVDNKIYCSGGNNNNNNFAIYDIATSTFGPLITNPLTGAINTMIAVNNKIYCSSNPGGSNGAQFSVYDISTGTFSSLITNPFTINRRIQAMVVFDDKIYCGGNSSSFAIYDISTDTFSSLITTPLSSINAMTIFNNKVYCVGGNPSQDNDSDFAIYDISTDTFSSLITTPFNYVIRSIIAVNNKIYLGNGGARLTAAPGQFVIYEEQPYGWRYVDLEITNEESLSVDIVLGEVLFSTLDINNGYPYKLLGGWIANLTVYNNDTNISANLPLEITIRDSTWVIDDYFYMKVGKTIYTNNLSINDSAILTYSYIPTDNLFNKVPNISYSDTELYLGFDNLLQITSNTKDGINILFNLPVINNQSFIANITSMLNISTSEVAIFFLNNITICSKVEDETFGFRYDYYNTKLSTGVRLGDSTINTLEGAFSIFPTRRGLAAMNYQAFMSTSDQVINYITNSIETYWTKFYDNSSIIKIIQWRDWLVITNLTKSILLFDLNRQTWWKWEVPLNVNQLLTDQIDLKLISDNLYVFKPHSIYKDFPAKRNQKNIDWYIHSQLLHFNRPTYFKNIRQLIFQIVDDVNNKNFENNGEETNNSIIAQMVLYRKRITNREPEVIGFKIDKIRTFVKRFNYWKINEVQWKLANDIETASPVKLQLDGVMIKYEIGEEVR